MIKKRTMKTINDFDFAGKRVLLRIDLNSPIVNGKVQDNSRFVEHAKTIRELLKKKAVVIILAHQGRKGKLISLKQHAIILNKYVKVKFVNDTIGKKAVRAIESLQSGQAILLENVRYLPEEYRPGNNKLVKVLGKRAHYYINDAFSMCHRNHTSMVSFARKLPSGIGRTLEKELENANKLKSRLKDSIFILGGNKPKDLIMLMRHGKILTTGTLSLLALKARGYKLGKQDTVLREHKKLIPKIRTYLRGTKTPVDLAISVNDHRKEISVNDLPTKSLILDIGKKTIKDYKTDIRKAKAVFFKGAAGYCESPEFCLGTKELLKTISSSSAFGVIAGGHSSSYMKKFRINNKKFGYVSLSGGALVHYLSGKKLPGLEVLK